MFYNTISIHVTNESNCIAGIHWYLNKLRCNPRIPIFLESTDNSNTFYKTMFCSIVRLSWSKELTCNIEKNQKLKTKLNTMELPWWRRGGTNLKGSGPIRLPEEAPSWTLQVGRRREEITRESSGLPSTGGEKNKQWRESVLEVMPYTTEPGTMNMSHGSIGHVRWSETW
jgi:hypothetical protein